jgi:hypothetical protein
MGMLLLPTVELIAVLRVHRLASNADAVCEASMRAIGQLGNDDASRGRLGDAGACEGGYGQPL